MSDQYLLPCACGQKVRVGRAQAGQEVACVCGKPVQVPTLRGLRELEVAPPEANAKTAGAWGPIRGALFSGGILVAVLALLFAGWQFWTYSIVSTMTTDHTQTVIAMEEEQIDEMSPADMFDVWHQIEEEGIGPKMIPIWVAAKQQATSLTRQAIFAIVIGVAGAIAAVGAAFVGRKS